MFLQSQDLWVKHYISNSLLSSLFLCPTPVAEKYEIRSLFIESEIRVSRGFPNATTKQSMQACLGKDSLADRSFGVTSIEAEIGLIWYELNYAKLPQQRDQIKQKSGQLLYVREKIGR